MPKSGTADAQGNAAEADLIFRSAGLVRGLAKYL
jgi:hypothetical protein